MSQNRYEMIATSDLPFNDRHCIILRHAAEMAEAFAVEARRYIAKKDELDRYWLNKAQKLLKAALSDLDNIQED